MRFPYSFLTWHIIRETPTYVAERTFNHAQTTTGRRSPVSGCASRHVEFPTPVRQIHADTRFASSVRRSLNVNETNLAITDESNVVSHTAAI